mmetsp:Transcript_119459/g.385694  ORF Transcript_119459/g.385694 Transcript_119459/m.385694 type:complete len:246 (+) Transcript_119459:129-866(+)
MDDLMLANWATRAAFSFARHETSSCICAISLYAASCGGSPCVGGGSRATLVASPMPSSLACICSWAVSCSNCPYRLFNCSAVSRSFALSARSWSPAAAASRSSSASCSGVTPAGALLVKVVMRRSSPFSSGTSTFSPVTLRESSVTIRFVTCFCRKEYGSAGLSFIRLCMRNCMKAVRPCLSRYSRAASSFRWSRSLSSSVPGASSPAAGPSPWRRTQKASSMPAEAAPSPAASKERQYSLSAGL